MIRPNMRGILPVSDDPSDLLDRVLGWTPIKGEQLKLDWSAGRFGQPSEWRGDEDEDEDGDGDA